MKPVAQPRSRLIAMLASDPPHGARRIVQLAITMGLCSGLMVALILHAVRNPPYGTTPWLLFTTAVLLAITAATIPPLLARTRALAAAQIAGLRERALPRLLCGSTWTHEVPTAFERLPAAIARAGHAAVAALSTSTALVIVCGYLLVADRPLGLVAMLVSACSCGSQSWLLMHLAGFHTQGRVPANAGGNPAVSAMAALRDALKVSAYDQRLGRDRIADVGPCLAVADAALLEQAAIGMRARLIALSLACGVVFAASVMAGPERPLSTALAALLLPFALATMLSSTLEPLFSGEQAARSWAMLEAMLDAAAPSAPATSGGTVVFQSVCGDTARPAMGPVDIALVPGAIALVTGGAGSGKSHLLSLLAGRLVASSGSILLDGERRRPAEAAALLRSQTILLATGSYPPVLPLAGRHVQELANLLTALGLDPARFLDGDALVCGQASSSEAFRAALAHAMLDPRAMLLIDDAAVDQDDRLAEVLAQDWLPRLAARGKAIAIASNRPAVRACATLEVNLVQGRQTDSDTARA